MQKQTAMKRQKDRFLGKIAHLKELPYVHIASDQTTQETSQLKVIRQLLFAPWLGYFVVADILSFLHLYKLVLITILMI